MERKRFVFLDCLLWIVPGVGAVFALAVACTEYRDEFLPALIAAVIGFVLLSLTSLGLFLRWGPLIPCMFVGMIVASMLSDGVSSSPEEGVFETLGMPLLGAICGAILGFVMESLRSDSPGSAQDD